MVVEDPPSLTTRLNIIQNLSNNCAPEIFEERNEQEKETKRYFNDAAETEASGDEEQEDEDDNDEGTDYSEAEASELVLTASENGILHDLDKVTNFGNVCVNNSSDVHLGNRTYFQGPVTIKQIMYTSPVGLPVDLQSALSNVNGISNSKVIFETGDGDSAGKRNGIGAVNGIDQNCIAISDNKNSIGANICDAQLEQGKQHRKFLSKHSTLVFSLILLLVIIIVFVLITVLFLIPKSTHHHINEGGEGGGGGSSKDPILLSNPCNISNYNPPEKLRIVHRTSWLAQPPNSPPTNLTLPVNLVIILHTATPTCCEEAVCVVQTRDIQSFHVDGRKWDDIAYSFLIGGDGAVYEGRGWFHVGAFAKGQNNKSYGIGFIGTFTNMKPTPRQLYAAQKLIEKGVELGYITKDYKVKGHRQFSATESPGLYLFHEIQLWPHFDPSYSY